MKYPLYHGVVIRSTWTIDGLPGRLDLNMVLTDDLGRPMSSPTISKEAVEETALALEGLEINGWDRLRRLCLEQEHRDRQIHHFFDMATEATIHRLHEEDGLDRLLDLVAKGRGGGTT